MLKKTDKPAWVFLGSLPIPRGARLVSDMGVCSESVPIGAALIQFTSTGRYCLYGAGGITSCNQKEAAVIDKENRDANHD